MMKTQIIALVLFIMLACTTTHAQKRKHRKHYPEPSTWEMEMTYEDSLRDQYWSLTRLVHREGESRNAYINDGSTRDSLYGALVYILDFVHENVRDSIIDSVWNYLRPRMNLISLRGADTLGYWNFIATGDLHYYPDSIISICPLFVSEQYRSEEEFSATCLNGFYVQNLGLLTVYFRTELEGYTWPLCIQQAMAAKTIYHEGLHAWLSSRYPEMDIDEQHAVIETIMQRIFEPISTAFFDREVQDLIDGMFLDIEKLRQLEQEQQMEEQK